MNKLFFKNVFAPLSAVTLAIGGFLVSAPQASAEISGKDLSADVAAADLSEIASKWPYLLLIGAVLVILICLVNVFYRIKKK